MNEICKMVFSLSVSGSILALVLFLIKPLIKNRLSKRCQYYIWLIIILRFLIPFTPETSVVGSLFYYLENNTTYSSALVEKGQIPAQTDNFSEREISQNTENLIFSVSSPNYWNEIKSSIWLLWLGVAVLLFVRKVTSYHSFIRYVKAGTHRIEEEKFLIVYKEVLTEVVIKKPLPIYVNQLVASPMLVGIFRPIIIIPKLELDDGELYNVFLHELIHYKRFDIFYKWLIQITVCLHWFNPLVYIINREINKNCELSCDEVILKGLDEKGRIQYGDTLLATIKTEGTYSDSIVSITLSENTKLLKERLGSILSFRKKSKIIIFISILLSSMFLAGATFAGAYTAGTIDKSDNLVDVNEKLDYKPWKLDDKAYPRDKTAKTDSFTLVDSPNVDITIDNNAAVDLVTTSDKEIAVDYNSTLYKVSVENKSGNWKIHISYLGKESVYSSAVMYVPDIIYGDINLQVKTATVNFNSVFQNVGNINADMYNSSISYIIPNQFTGGLNAIVSSNSYLDLESDNGYKNCKVSIKRGEGWLIEDFPDSFTKRNSTFTYSNGTQEGNIKFNLKDGGYAVIKGQ